MIKETVDKDPLVFIFKIHIPSLKLKSLRSENHNPVFIFLIEALGPISCKNLKNL